MMAMTPWLSDWESICLLSKPSVAFRWMASQSPSLTTTASAHVMSKLRSGPIWTPAAHFQAVQWLATMLPTPKDELVSPHQPMSAGSWQARGTEAGDIDMMYLTHVRLVEPGSGGVETV